MIRIVVDGQERSFAALPITIGRDIDNDIPLDDNKLSRRHCRIVRDPDGFVLEDLESSNGSFVNGVRADRQVLAAGDTVTIGVSTLNVEWDPEAEPPRWRKKRDESAQVADLDSENLRLRRMVNLIKAVASATEEDALLRLIVDSAVELTGAERGFLFLVTLHGLDFKVARNRDKEDLDHPQEMISHSIASEAVESGHPVMTEDAGGDARFAGGRSVAYLRLRSVMCVPLKVQHGPIGALYLENSDVTAQFHADDVPFVTTFCEFVALILAKARTLDALARREEQLRRSRERIGRLNARLKKMLRRQSQELAGVRADLDVSRHELGIRYDYSAIVGTSPPMRAVLALLDRVMESDLPVLVTGESGTGKELMARAVHYNARQREGRLVAINCAAVPSDLIEVEFFGREAGAFTGADEAAPGLFEQADGGTLFLDEVGAMPLELQSKLLRVMETGEYRRIGGTETRTVKLRTVSASNRELRAMARDGAFREDLFYRLAGVEITLPPLRERLEDVPTLFDHFVDTICAEQEIERPEIDPEVIDRLQAYPWPGNVRELRNEVQRVLALQRGVISPDLLSLSVFSGDPEAVPPTQLPEGGLKELVESLEKRVIADTLKRVEGNKTRAAAILSLSRLGLRKKMERYGLRSDA
ncbi:MAG: sigma 54-interacting transcriptional regulator [Planctomycetota bacterium]|jgi:transcriptional regulator with GAF, ATPase, and Fis domain